MSSVIVWIAIGCSAFGMFAAILALAWVSKVQDEIDKLADHVTRPWSLAPSPPVGGSGQADALGCHPDCPVCPDHQLTEAQQQAYNRAAIRRAARESGTPFPDEQNSDGDGGSLGIFQQGKTWSDIVRDAPLPPPLEDRAPRKVLTRDPDGKPIYLTNGFGPSAFPQKGPDSYDPHKPHASVRPERNDS